MNRSILSRGGILIETLNDFRNGFYVAVKKAKNKNFFLYNKKGKKCMDLCYEFNGCGNIVT